MTNVVQELNKLKNIQQHLEKNESALMEQMSRIELNTEITSLHKEATASRHTQVTKLQHEVKNILAPMQNIRKIIKDENIDNLDLKVVKKDMTNIQNNIQNLKTTTMGSLLPLKKTEEKLVEDMKILDEKMQEWNKFSDFPRKSVIRKTKTAPENVSREVKAFMTFVSTSGGHENGWSIDDHNLFLKIRGKTINETVMVEILRGLLPDMSEDEILAHETWYKKYLDLKEKQKRSIKDWRTSKDKKVVKTTKKSVQERPLADAFKSLSDFETKLTKQQRLDEWKADKRKKELAREEQKLLQEHRQKMREKEEKEKQKEKKAKVSNWRTERARMEEAERREKYAKEIRDRVEKASKANKLIKQFQDQDEAIIRRKLQQRYVRPKSANVDVIHLKPDVPRDPERLLKATKQWIMRTYGTEITNIPNKLAVQAIPKLGIPEWRKHIV